MNLFTRRDKDKEKWGDRLPPGQKPTDGWPVLHYGGIPKIDLATWRLEFDGLLDEPAGFSWDEFMALPQISTENDIHCVTTWSKFDNVWTGVSVLELFSHLKIKPDAKAVMIHSYGGYTTNLPIGDVAREGNLFAVTHNGEPLSKEHGWPVRLVVPHLYFWKSAKWIKGMHFIPENKPGFWEMYGYHMNGDPFKEERYS
jgi:DMSO/TMAO reductase YedYZ molybdopterin-dependent catalytic subunit